LAGCWHSHILCGQHSHGYPFYGKDLEARLEDLSARIRRMGYRPQPVRRSYIPKGDGRYRPLGVPTVIA